MHSEQGKVIVFGVTLESTVAFLYVELTGTFWMLIQKSMGMVLPFLRFGRTSHRIYRLPLPLFSPEMHSSLSELIITPHAQRERGKVIGRGVHIYIYIYVCGRKKNLNRTLEIDSPFQTLTVGLLVEFID